MPAFLCHTYFWCVSLHTENFLYGLCLFLLSAAIQGHILQEFSLENINLYRSLAPKRQLEGSIGGIVTATAISVIYGVCIERSFALNGVNTVLLCTLTGIIGSVLSQFGDLAASAIKRYVGLKDYGNLIPGHGGILDRFDSVLFTAPVVYYVMLFSIKIF